MKLEREIGQAESLDCLCRARRERDGADASCLALNGFSTIARALYDERRHRDLFFRASLFAEPAWDMLLDLRFQADSMRPTSVSSACIGSAAPASTALRHLIALENEGLVERTVDPDDARRKLTRLSRDGAQLMDAYLAEVALTRISRFFR